MKNLLLLTCVVSLIACSREEPKIQETTSAVEQANRQAAEQQQRTSDALRRNITKQSKSNTSAELGK